MFRPQFFSFFLFPPPARGGRAGALPPARPAPGSSCSNFFHRFPHSPRARRPAALSTDASHRHPSSRAPLFTHAQTRKRRKRKTLTFSLLPPKASTAIFALYHNDAVPAPERRPLNHFCAQARHVGARQARALARRASRGPRSPENALRRASSSPRAKSAGATASSPAATTSC